MLEESVLCDARTEYLCIGLIKINFYLRVSFSPSRCTSFQYDSTNAQPCLHFQATLARKEGGQNVSDKVKLFKKKEGLHFQKN
jgi:hypothetical protein